MASTQAAKRYARAAFQLAVQENRADAVCTDLIGIGALLRESPELAKFIANLIIPADKRVQTLQALFTGKVDALTLRFLLFLESKKRLGALSGIVDEISRLYNEQQGVLNVEITAASALDDTQRDAIRSKLAARFGKKIIATSSVDPKLLGGFIVQVGGTIYDYSLETQLQSLGRKLASA